MSQSFKPSPLAIDLMYMTPDQLKFQHSKIF